MIIDRIAVLGAEWTRAKAGALEFIDAIPDGLIGYKPVPEVFSFAEQFIHIGSVNYIFGAAAGERENPFDKTKGSDPEKDELLKATRAALRGFALGSYDFMIGVIGSLNADQLDQEIQFHKWNMSRGVMLAKALEHHSHHRGQTVLHFRLNGIKPPGERLF